MELELERLDTWRCIFDSLKSETLNFTADTEGVFLCWERCKAIGLDDHDALESFANSLHDSIDALSLPHFHLGVTRAVSLERKEGLLFKLTFGDHG